MPRIQRRRSGPPPRFIHPLDPSLSTPSGSSRPRPTVSSSSSSSSSQSTTDSVDAADIVQALSAMRITQPGRPSARPSARTASASSASSSSARPRASSPLGLRRCDFSLVRTYPIRPPVMVCRRRGQPGHVCARRGPANPSRPYPYRILGQFAHYDPSLLDAEDRMVDESSESDESNESESGMSDGIALAGLVGPLQSFSFQIAPADMHLDTPTDAPTDTPMETPVGTPEDAPEDTPEDMPEDAPEDTPEDMPLDAEVTVVSNRAGSSRQHRFNMARFRPSRY